MKKAITLGIFLMLTLVAPVMLHAEAPSTAPGSVPGEQVRNSDDLGQSSTALVTKVETYDQLLVAVRETRVASRVRVEKVVEQERVREAWEIGRLIDAHVLQYKERAGYAESVLTKLSGDLGMSERELYYSLRFYRAYPILPHAAKLSWSEYRDLLSVDDPKERQVLAERTEKENWDRSRLRKEVKAVTGKSSASELVSEKLSPSTPGKPGTYKIVKATVGPETGKWVIDLGFSNYYKTSKDLRFKEGAIIEEAFAVPGAGSAPSDLLRLSKRTPEDLYTYCAYVVKVLDGDTLKVVVDLGFGVRSVQTLRLRGIDAPEIATADGMKAKEFLESVIASGAKQSQGDGIAVSPAMNLGGLLAMTAKFPILIKTVKSDKYDRYLADVFVGGVYINQKLIDEGLAVRVQS